MAAGDLGVELEGYRATGVWSLRVAVRLRAHEGSVSSSSRKWLPCCLNEREVSGGYAIR